MNDTAKPQPGLALQSDDGMLAAKPILRSDLKIDVRNKSGRLVAVIEDSTRCKFFQVGHLEYHFISMLDGRRTVADLIEAMKTERAFDQFSEETARSIISWLGNMHLLDGPGAPSSQRLAQSAQAKQKQKWLALLNPISFRFVLPNPNHTLSKITPWTQWLFNVWMLIVWLAIGIAAISLVSAQTERLASSAVGILSPSRWIWLLLIWLVLKILHECGHVIACQKYGGEVRQAGLLFLLFVPLAFVDVTSSWRFASRRKRLLVSAAGMYVELLIAFIAAIVWAYCETGLISDLTYNIMIMAGISTLLFNANPLIRFDGYYILADMLGIANLYTKGQNWFSNRFHMLAFGFPVEPNICPAHELRYVAIYGIAAFVWRIILCASLLLVASALFNGFGLVLAVVGGIFWVVLPIVQHARKVRQLAEVHTINRRRLAVFTAATACGIAACFFLFQAPAATRVPAIVQFNDEQILRAAADGFVDGIFITDGQLVSQGDLLVRLKNPQIQLELTGFQKSAEQATVRARMHRQRGELSLQQAELSKLRSIEQQIAEKEHQIRQLDIRAPLDGRVFRRGLDDLTESFVKQGDSVLRIAKQNKNEILISISQEQFEAVKKNENLPVRVAFAGFPLMTGFMKSIEPRASDEPIDISLTAVAGGPLAVRPSTPNSSRDDNGGDHVDYRLLTPRFTAKLLLEAAESNRLQAGQRGTAFVYGRDVSLGKFWLLRCRSWVRETLEKATLSTF